MSYALRNDGLGWRAVASAADCAANETFSETQPVLNLPPYFMPVSPWQIRKALTAAGLRDSVEAAIAAADQATKDAWQFASEFKRDDPLVNSIAAGLGKTAAEIDALFTAAASM